MAGWDVCIIGGGAAGLMAAAHLAAGGARTLLLEGGTRIPIDEIIRLSKMDSLEDAR